jgi:hypothetical protein
MLGAFIAVLVIPPLRDFFDLSMPPAIIVFACIGLTSLAAQALTLEERVLAHYGLPVLADDEDEDDEAGGGAPLPPPLPAPTPSVRSERAQADPARLTGS